MTFFLLLAVFLLGVFVGRALQALGPGRRGDVTGELERDIIRAAMQRGGRVTALDVRPRQAVSLAEIEDHLRSLHAQGYCHSDITREAYPVYIFPAFDDAPLRALQIEKKIIRLARNNGGVVHVSAVAVETDLSYLDARHVLDEMVAEGICEPSEEADAYRFFPPRLLGESERLN